MSDEPAASDAAAIQDPSAKPMAPTSSDRPSDAPGVPSAAEQRSRLSGVASSLAGAAAPVIGAVEHLTSGARRAIEERSGARVRRARRMGREPLVNLWDVHPEARRASVRELGLMTVPIDEIAGTAVDGPIQRGGDFLPVRDRRGHDWRARWQRILGAVDRLDALPPVDLLRVADRYWVVDGHNRVAAGLYTGQVAIDANVSELRLPGGARREAAGNLAPYLEGSRDLREAGSGRLTRTSVRPSSGLPQHPLDDHHEHRDDQFPAPGQTERETEASPVESTPDAGGTDQTGA